MTLKLTDKLSALKAKLMEVPYSRDSKSAWAQYRLMYDAVLRDIEAARQSRPEAGG